MARKAVSMRKARDILRLRMGYVARGTPHQFVDNDMEAAGTAFEKGLDLAPTNRAAAISYADYLWEMNEKDKAISSRWFRRCLS